ncbi:spermatogenesis-associated protein 1 isoform X3 [Dunckerocampus dactyliophorus]|uniref:spermatogenesis-associated protein 1 isoform X3 n=1 Tax=Dunckerocampus dactyliophorus TaxID=161453 RepID=UPI002405795D|nr:spermatogenesis-associated protein 1 isoform X3 [Dunckerocampus dactyliophorus]
MELSCESAYTVDRRPISCKLLELHVLYVPDEQWNVKLNKVPADATESFISAGFIRVHPDVTLKALRTELADFLGSERSVDKFSFLKCVGRSLALVKSQQEKDVKVKTFAPPYADQPELYLLPAADDHSSLYSHSIGPDTSGSSPDPPTFYPRKTWSSPAETKESVKFPHIPQSSHQLPSAYSLEEEEEDEEQSYSSSEGDEGHQENDEEEEEEEEDGRCGLRKSRNQKTSQPLSHNKALARVTEEGRRRKKKGYQKVTRDAGVEEAHSDRLGKARDVRTFRSPRSKAASGAPESPIVLSRPVRCTSPPPGLDLTMTTQKASAPTNRTRGGNQAGEGGTQAVGVEKTRTAQERKRLVGPEPTPPQPSWKKKYFDTKKATAPLEDALKSVRQELETFYNKVLHQLHARDNRGRPQKQGRCSEKNELIIQILTESHEIDNLKRKVEDAKMKLVTEMKLRKQAATELRGLKAELAQKKSQSCRHGPAASLSFGSAAAE